MDRLINLLMAMAPEHWFVLGLVLLIAEMASGTTYLLWPAVAAFITGLIAMTGLAGWAVEIVIFAVLVIALTAFGRPLVQRFRAEAGSPHLNERGAQLIGARGVVTAFAGGTGAVKIDDTIWRATSEEALAPGESVEIAAVDGVTLKVKRAG
jgi:membrane protein implicated in regulation of membrane protease activity